jgi:general secretion pathway protein K
MKRVPPASRQRGVAMLTAILLVALGTILATGIAYQNAMTARRGAGTFAFDQSIAVAEAAEALAAYALAQDAKEGQQADFPAESWNKPFGPVEVVPGVALEARLQDAQARFNLNSLVDGNGVKDDLAIAEFKRLLAYLELEEKWASLIVDWIDRDQEPAGFDGGEDNLYSAQTPAYRTLGRPITSTSELLALPGFGRDRYLKLAPYVVALPQDAKLNVCAADPVVLNSMTATPRNPEGETGFNETAAKSRESSCFPSTEVFLTSVDPNDKEEVGKRISQTSNYFILTSVVTVGNTQFALYSLLYRNRGQVRPIMRSFSAD